MYTTTICLNCQQEFQVEKRELNRGRGKFCTSKCSGLYLSKTRPKPSPNVICAQCSKEFYKNNSKKKNSKSNLHFCSRKCKDSAQRIGGIREIMPSHYGEVKSKYGYRLIAFRDHNKPKICERCSYNEHEAAIIIHHKDRNRLNNDISNLEVLCCNCHAIEHWSEDQSAL